MDRVLNLDGMHTLGMTRRLYMAMPGAAPVQTSENGAYAWGEVEGTDHYKFAERMVSEIMSAAYSAFHDAKKKSNHTNE